MNANLILHFSMNYMLKYNFKCTQETYEILMSSPWYHCQIFLLLDPSPLKTGTLQVPLPSLTSPI